MDSYTFIEDNLSGPRTVATDYHSAPALMRKKGYYEELATTPAKVDPRTLARPLAPPGKLVWDRNPGRAL